MKVLVLAGGNSNEREISLKSGKSVALALQNLNHQVFEYDTTNGLAALKDYIGKVDAVFPILHGKEGEDGTVQAKLEESGFKFLGSSSIVSKLCFDKSVFKNELKRMGILTPDWEVVNSKTILKSRLMEQPFVLKPVSGGSSIDTFIVRTPKNASIDYQDVFSRYSEMLLEELIEGVEITVPVLDKTSLPVIEIVPPKGKEFDYENKYNGETKEICPPLSISKPLQQQAQLLAEKIHNSLGVRHLSRSDMIITNDKNIYVLELNTIPGLTNQSLFPKAAKEAGISMEQLAQKFLVMALRI